MMIYEHRAGGATFMAIIYADGRYDAKVSTATNPKGKRTKSGARKPR